MWSEPIRDVNLLEKWSREGCPRDWREVIECLAQDLFPTDQMPAVQLLESWIRRKN